LGHIAPATEESTKRWLIGNKQSAIDWVMRAICGLTITEKPFLR
jgi:hypothetical protein